MQRSAISVNVDFQRRSVSGSIRPFFFALIVFLFSGMPIPKKVHIPSSAVCDRHTMSLLRYKQIRGINQRSRSVRQPEAADANGQSGHGQSKRGQNLVFHSDSVTTFSAAARSAGLRRLTTASESAIPSVKSAPQADRRRLRSSRFKIRPPPFDRRQQSELREWCPAPERDFPASGDNNETRMRFRRGNSRSQTHK